MSQHFKRTGDLFSFLNQLWYFKRHQMCLIKDIHLKGGIKSSMRLFSFIVLYFFWASNIMGLYSDFFFRHKKFKKTCFCFLFFALWTYCQNSRCAAKARMLEVQLDSIIVCNSNFISIYILEDNQWVSYSFFDS